MRTKKKNGVTFFIFWFYPLVYNCSILHLTSCRRNTKKNKSQGLRGGVGIWSVSNFPQFLYFESRNAISNFRWRLSIVSVKSFNQFIVIYYSVLLLPTEAHYLSLDYKWRRRRRQRRENKKESRNKHNPRRPWNCWTPAELAGRDSRGHTDGESFFEA